MGSINLFEGLSFLSLVLDWVIGWLLVFWGLFNCFYSPVYFFFDLEFLHLLRIRAADHQGLQPCLLILFFTYLPEATWRFYDTRTL